MEEKKKLTIGKKIYICFVALSILLIISSITTMFVMVYVVRWLINAFAKASIFETKARLFVGYKEKRKERKFAFTKMRKYSFVGLAVLLILGIVSMCTNGLNLGIDFKSGSAITVISENPSCSAHSKAERSKGLISPLKYLTKTKTFLFFIC